MKIRFHPGHSALAPQLVDSEADLAFKFYISHLIGLIVADVRMRKHMDEIGLLEKSEIQILKFKMLNLSKAAQITNQKRKSIGSPTFF